MKGVKNGQRQERDRAGAPPEGSSRKQVYEQLDFLAAIGIGQEQSKDEATITERSLNLIREESGRWLQTFYGDESGQRVVLCDFPGGWIRLEEGARCWRLVKFTRQGADLHLLLPD